MHACLSLSGYSCAWQKEILIQGRLYITAHYLCFYSSILGFETKVNTLSHSLTHLLTTHNSGTMHADMHAYINKHTYMYVHTHATGKHTNTVMQLTSLYTSTQIPSMYSIIQQKLLIG